jgi:hypothetical protein
MSDKFTSVSEEFLREVIDSDLAWMDAAQTLAYLIGGVNGAGAEETLRLGRFRLGKLFEGMYHDAACWDEIAKREEASEYIRVFASERAKALRDIADKAYKRFETRTEGR